MVHEGESLDVLYFISHGSFEVKQNDHVVGLLGKLTNFAFSSVCPGLFSLQILLLLASIQKDLKPSIFLPKLFFNLCFFRSGRRVRRRRMQ